MICELCGKEGDRLRKVVIEGSRLQVCSQCAKFGDVDEPDSEKSTTKSEIERRLKKRERRMKSRDVYDKGETIDLAPDYHERIRKARNERGLKQEELAAKINEKKSIINKLESGDFRPDDSLVKKLEKMLGIKLMEKVPVIKPEKKATSSQGLTLGDLMNLEEK